MLRKNKTNNLLQELKQKCNDAYKTSEGPLTISLNLAIELAIKTECDLCAEKRKKESIDYRLPQDRILNKLMMHSFLTKPNAISFDNCKIHPFLTCNNCQQFELFNTEQAKELGVTPEELAIIPRWGKYYLKEDLLYFIEQKASNYFIRHKTPNHYLAQINTNLRRLEIYYENT